MPTYNSLGISASLVVADLATTLSDRIEFRMGAQQMKEAQRISESLAKGSKLSERPLGTDGKPGGTMQFVGENGDMALYIVEAGNVPQDERKEMLMPKGAAGDEGTSSANIESTPVNASFAWLEAHTPANAHPSIEATPAQTIRDQGMTSLEGDNDIDDHMSILAMETAGADKGKQRAVVDPDVPVTPEPGATSPQMDEQNTGGDLMDPLALTLTVDCTKYSNMAKNYTLGGKDLKLEAFLNGMLVEVIYEALSRTRPKRQILIAGTRIHRQAEKPWVYAANSTLSNSGMQSDQRWNHINQRLQEEADACGIDKWKLRPVSAQFITALAKLQLPESISANDQPFGVIDLVITAGSGQKDGPSSTYLTAPTRLRDARFRRENKVIDVEALVQDEGEKAVDDDGDITMEDRDSTMGDGQPDSSSFQAPAITTNQGPTVPSSTDQKQPEAPPSPHTPPPKSASGQDFLRPLYMGKAKELIDAHDGALDKGMRSLKQRLAYMSQMNAMNQQKAMGAMQGELDDATMNAIREALETNNASPIEAPRKKPRTALDFAADAAVPDPISSSPTYKKVCFGGLPARMGGGSDEEEAGPSSPAKMGGTRAQREHDAALRDFEIPALCVGSTISYADGQRQMIKARGGRFAEDEFVVGMRFIVL